MSKQFDLAQEIEQRQRDEALKAHAEKPRGGPHKYDDEGRRICFDCKERLPQKRLRANPHASRCVECQETKEQQDRRKR